MDRALPQLPTSEVYMRRYADAAEPKSSVEHYVRCNFARCPEHGDVPREKLRDGIKAKGWWKYTEHNNVRLARHVGDVVHADRVARADEIPEAVGPQVGAALDAQLWRVRARADVDLVVVCLELQSANSRTGVFLQPALTRVMPHAVREGVAVVPLSFFSRKDLLMKSQALRILAYDPQASGARKRGAGGRTPANGHKRMRPSEDILTDRQRRCRHAARGAAVPSDGSDSVDDVALLKLGVDHPPPRVLVVLVTHANKGGQIFSCTPKEFLAGGLDRDHPDHDGFGSPHDEFCTVHDFVMVVQDSLRDGLLGVHLSACSALDITDDTLEYPHDAQWYIDKLRTAVTGYAREVQCTDGAVFLVYLAAVVAMRRPRDHAGYVEAYDVVRGVLSGIARGAGCVRAITPGDAHPRGRVEIVPREEDAFANIPTDALMCWTPGACPRVVAWLRRVVLPACLVRDDILDVSVRTLSLSPAELRALPEDLNAYLAFTKFPNGDGGKASSTSGCSVVHDAFVDAAIAGAKAEPLGDQPRGVVVVVVTGGGEEERTVAASVRGRLGAAARVRGTVFVGPPEGGSTGRSPAAAAALPTTWVVPHACTPSCCEVGAAATVAPRDAPCHAAFVHTACLLLYTVMLVVGEGWGLAEILEELRGEARELLMHAAPDLVPPAPDVVAQP